MRITVWLFWGRTYIFGDCWGINAAWFFIKEAVWSKKGGATLHIMSWVVSTTPTAISFSIYRYTSRFSTLRRLPNPNLSLNALPWPPRSRPLTFRTAALLQDAGAAAAVTAGAYGLGLTFDTLTQRKIIEQVAYSLSLYLIWILLLWWKYGSWTAVWIILATLRRFLMELKSDIREFWRVLLNWRGFVLLVLLKLC